MRVSPVGPAWSEGTLDDFGGLLDGKQPRLCVWGQQVELHSSPPDNAYSTQSAMKMLVSCGTLPLRFEAHTSRLPSEVNMGNASKSG